MAVAHVGVVSGPLSVCALGLSVSDGARRARAAGGASPRCERLLVQLLDPSDGGSKGSEETYR